MATIKCQAGTEPCFGGGHILLEGGCIPLCNLVNHAGKELQHLWGPKHLEGTFQHWKGGGGERRMSASSATSG